MNRLVPAIAALFLIACSSSSDSGDTSSPADVVASDVKGDTQPDVPSADTASDVLEDLAPDVTGLTVPPGPESRGWQVLRGIVHMHSALSHDGCAADGYEDFGGPDPACMAELHAAPCANDIDFLMMTDHPGHSSDHTFEEMLQYNEADGDELWRDDQERVFANRITCQPADSVPEVFVFAGTEGHKHMPIGMSGPIPEKVFQQAYENDQPLEEVQAAAQLVRESGGFVFIPHPEEDNMSVERIVEVPLDGIEIYNIHANIAAILESMDSIFTLERFLEGSTNAPESDLVMLLFLDPVVEDTKKFDAAATQIRLSHIAATDIHRSVEIPALCPGEVEGSLCEPLVEDYPNFAAYAAKGGPIPMADGDRLDSYPRSFRWLSNRALVAERDPQLIREAIGKGRSYSAFDLFGYPAGFDFYLSNGEATVEMGEETTYADGMTLYFNSPVVQASPWREDAGWEFGEAEVSCELLRAGTNGTESVQEAIGQGVQAEVSVTSPGAYRVYCSIVPHHLEPVLPGVQYLAKKSFPYIYSNAIFIR